MDSDIKTFLVPIEAKEQRLDHWLVTKLPECSRSEISRLIADGEVEVKGKNKIKAGLKLSGGEAISVRLSAQMPLSAEPQAMDLDIVYEDEDLLVINKPQGMVVHPAPGHYSGTLVNGLLYHCKQLSDLSGEFRPGIVHRLDKDTAGLLVVAKNNATHRKLAEDLAVHAVKRIYAACVWGQPSADRGRIDAPIGRDQYNRQRMAINADGKQAITDFYVLERYANSSLVEFHLHTGRTHQIRVHSKYIGCPVIGDPVYAANRPTYFLKGQALVARAISFVHPNTEEELSFSIDLPSWFIDLKKTLVAEVGGKYGK